MAQNIPTIFVDEYKQRIELALQHNGSVYRSAVAERPASGEQSVEVDLVGMVPMKPITQRLQPIVNDDFRTDREWGEYAPFCDVFYFAVAPEFPLEALPDGPGLIVADGFGGAVVREAAPVPLAPARRKALTLAFARLGAMRSLRE